MHCQRRNEECLYPLQPSYYSTNPVIAPRPETRSSSRQPENTLEVQYQDFELYDFFIQSTGPSLVDDALTVEFWQHDLPQQAFKDQSLLHVSLSLAGLHLSQRSPDRHAALQARADEHYKIALPTMISRLSDPNAQWNPSVQMSAVLICFCYLAKGPQPGEYLVFSDEGEAEWFSLFRGARSIIQASGFSRPRKQLAGQTTSSHTTGETPAAQSCQTPDRSATTPGGSAIPSGIDFLDRFHRFHDFLSSAAVEGAAFSVQLTALDFLKATVTARYGSAEEASAINSTNEYSHVIFSWLYRISDEFISTLHQKRPASLVIFSFYAVLLKDYKPSWLMHGWPEHILSGVSKHLHPRYQHWVEGL